MWMFMYKIGPLLQVHNLPSFYYRMMYLEISVKFKN